MYLNFTLDEFCGSQFWNGSLTWYTDSPELTPCFQKTVLVWVPCLYLWAAALLDAYYILHSKERNIPWNILNISKLLVTCLLIVLKFVDLGVTVHTSSKEEEQVFNADYYSPIVKIFTFVLAATLLYYNKKYGMRASGVLFFFWLLLVLAGLPECISAIRTHINSKENVQYKFITQIVYSVMIFVMFLLNCFADLPPRESPYKFRKNQSPESAAGVPSRLTFSWFDPLALTGFRKSLTEDDLWELNPPDTAAEVVPKFEKYWEKTIKKRDSEAKASFSKTDGRVEFKMKRLKPASVLPALCLAFGPQFLFGEILKITADILVFLSPKILELIIGFVESDEPAWKGYLYAGGLFGCGTLQTLLLGHYFKKMYLVGMRIRTSLTSAIYKKALRMSNAAKKDSTSGEIINLMSVDAYRFLELTAFLNMVWSAPLQIVLAIYFLWGVLGPSVMAGLAGMVVLLPFTGLLANIQKTLEVNQMKFQDERVKLMNEILNGIKVLKIYAWEPSFEQQVHAIREKELNILKKTAYLYASKSFIWTCTPFIVSLMSFGCFVLINDTEVLDSKKAFVALSLFNILRFPLAMLPNVISQVIQAAVGIKRINKFMNCNELDFDAIEHNPNEPNPITIENGSFSWGGVESPAVLRNISMEVPRGALVAVVGAVGSGKSSLLAALLAEMTKLAGRVNTTGSIAYVPQQPWIQNATLQDNIVFGKPLDSRRYSEVIDVCALRPDFEVLPGGDQTEIGEKGINLSGGQKQRVSLARAVYCGADNYFLDDPLSAVDSHVGKHIFDKVIGPGGLLAGRTRVWVTHNVSYLAQTDLVVVLRDGEVSEAGSYQQLLEKKGAFADFLLHHLSDAQRTSPEELEKLKHDIESKLGSDFHKKLQRARSQSETSETSQPGAGDKANGNNIATLDSNTKEELKKQNKLIEAETAETGSVKWIVYKHYLKSIGVMSLIASLLMFLVVRLFLIGSDFWLAKWSSDTSMLVNGTVDTKKRDMYLGVYGGLGLGQASATFFADLIFFLACWRAGKIIHAMLLNSILKAPLQFFEVTPAGRILARFSKDVGILDSSLTWQASNTIGCAFELIGSIFVISFSTPIFTSVIVPIGVLYFLLQRYFVSTSRQLMRLESISSSPIYSHFGETVAGASTIRAYGVTQRFIDKSESYVDRNQSFYYPSCIADRWLGIRLETVGNLIIFFASLFAVLARGSISPGLVGLSITYSLEVTMTLNWMVRMISEVETNIVAVERIKEYTDIKQEAPWVLEGESAADASWPATGALRLEQLTLGYRAGEPALRDVTCAVAPRDKLGIVGRTGAGKSTLTLGLFRIVEAARGRILIDGVDIASLGLHQLRSRITIIPQDPVLFAGTLRTNLDPFGAHSDDDLWRALEHAHLKAFVHGLPAGLRHEVAEGGENLSVGQRQLVCLARALLRKTPLLVLDEATAAVDLETDELIQKTIRSEFAACTVLTIAHRLNTILDCTKVMVLDKGQLVEYAPPDQLLQDHSSLFYSMAKDAGLVD